jgi:hypothetical protein
MWLGLIIAIPPFHSEFLDLVDDIHFRLASLPERAEYIAKDLEAKTDDTTHDGLQRVVQQKRQVDVREQIERCSEEEGNPIARSMILIYFRVHGSNMQRSKSGGYHSLMFSK